MKPRGVTENNKTPAYVLCQIYIVCKS